MSVGVYLILCCGICSILAFAGGFWFALGLQRKEKRLTPTPMQRAFTTGRN